MYPCVPLCTIVKAGYGICDMAIRTVKGILTMGYSGYNMIFLISSIRSTDDHPVIWAKKMTIAHVRMLVGAWSFAHPFHL